MKTDTMTMTISERHHGTLTDFTTRLSRLDQLYYRTKTTEKEEEIKSPHFVFLKISANAPCTHLQIRPSQSTAKALQKSAILPALKKERYQVGDVHDIETRSYKMSQIKGKDTKPEILVRKFICTRGFRFSLHNKKLPGKPDIVLKKYKTIIDVRGCFWHLHSGCKYGD